jgi:glucose/mannose-6-phosphate isomerase
MTPATYRAGVDRMRALALEFPQQLETGYRAGRELDLGPFPGATTIRAVGMGGSAIALDLARILVEAETSIHLALQRSPVLPRGLGNGDPAILVSYSGNTWETLEAYKEAGRRRARRIVLSSGGELTERAERDHAPLVVLPPGLPPRSTAAFQLGSLLGLLDSAFEESNEARLHRAAERVRSQGRAWSSHNGLAHRIARAIGRSVPVVYTDSQFSPVARRWATQLEENAKRMAFYDEVPEILHNALVGWDATGRLAARRFAPILLHRSGVPPLTLKGLSHLAQVLNRREARLVETTIPGDDLLEQVAQATALGDHVSIHLAEALKVDPYPVETIVRLKAALTQPRRRR